MPTKARHGSEVREALPLFAYARDHAEPRRESPAVPFVSSGLDSLDAVLGGGFATGALGLIAARPKVGATSLLLGACAQALRDGLRVAYLSERLTEPQLRGRLVVLESRVNGYRFRAGLASAEDRQALVAARERIAWQQLSLVTGRRQSFEAVASHLFEYRPALAVLDCTLGRHGDPAYLSHVVPRLSRLAAEHGVALLWRVILQRGDERPDVSELPPSDVVGCFPNVLMLHREEVTLSGLPDDALGWAEAHVVRAQNEPGPSEPIRLRFDQRFAGLLDP